MYFATIISYGNIYAYNQFERIFSLMLMLLAGILMAQGISTLSQIVSALD